ncbi:MAG: SIR2 family NAD-dependent protein deacylase [Candidatus Bruticola sp.]
MTEKIRVKDYPNIVVLTGAGISAASGIAPFRGPGGLWTDKDIQECATAQALKRHPQKVWDAFAPVRKKSNEVSPNPAHLALAELEKRTKNTWILTQNIDELHQKAGSRHVIELHGTIHRSQCSRYCTPPFVDKEIKFRSCSHCGAPLRYDIVLFNESLDPEVLASSYDLLEHADLFLVVGTSGIVYPAAGFVPIAKQAGARVVIINLEELAYNGSSIEQINGKAEEILPHLFDYD